MSASNYVNTVYARLWELLLAHDGFTSKVKANNRIRFDNDSVAYPIPEQITDGDVPMAVLGLGAFSDQLYTGTQHYGMVAGATVADLAKLGWVEQVTQEYTLTLLHADCRLRPATLLLHEALTALRRGGPRLGTADLGVVRWGPVSGPSVIVRTGAGQGDGDGTPRLQHALTIPVTFQLKGSTLL